MRLYSIVIIFLGLFVPVVVTAQDQNNEAVTTVNSINQIPSVADTLLQAGITGSAVSAMGIDMIYDNIINDEEIINCEDGLLLIYIKPGPISQNPTLKDVAFVSSEANLVALDGNRNGIIGAIDPNFSRLYILMLYNYGRSYRIVPFHEVGGRAIILNSKTRESLGLPTINDFISTSSYAVMADGSHRLISLLQVKNGTLKALQGS